MADYVINFVASSLLMYKIKELVKKSSSIFLQNLILKIFMVAKINYFNGSYLMGVSSS